MGFTKYNHLVLCIRYANALHGVIIFILIMVWWESSGLEGSGRDCSWRWPIGPGSPMLFEENGTLNSNQIKECERIMQYPSIPFIVPIAIFYFIGTI